MKTKSILMKMIRKQIFTGEDNETKGRSSKLNPFRDFPFFFPLFSRKVNSLENQKTNAFLNPDHHFQHSIWISTLHFLFFIFFNSQGHFRDY